MEYASSDIRFDVPLAEACFEDRQEFCGNVPPGSARVIRCLQDRCPTLLLFVLGSAPFAPLLSHSTWGVRQLQAVFVRSGPHALQHRFCCCGWTAWMHCVQSLLYVVACMGWQWQRVETGAS